MQIIDVRNAHEALPQGLRLLGLKGVHRESRNGPVMVVPEPVATVYRCPTERVVFWEDRDANPFFHLYESLWMLAGRRDIQPLVNYVKRMVDYSDDGVTLHDAYGYRWRSAFGKDQLGIIADRLRKDPDDRRCVLQMWEAAIDLGRQGKAVPCNTTATFQINQGALDLTVFCRSNDIIWGAYGANAVQFGTLLEYMAAWIEVPIGIYTQVSVNWHAYIEGMESLRRLAGEEASLHGNPYSSTVRVCPLITEPGFGQIAHFNDELTQLFMDVDTHFVRFLPNPPRSGMSLFTLNTYHVLMAHECYRSLAAPERYDQALRILGMADQSVDWVVAAKEWITRRRAKWEAKLTR